MIAWSKNLLMMRKPRASKPTPTLSKKCKENKKWKKSNKRNGAEYRGISNKCNRRMKRGESKKNNKNRNKWKNSAKKEGKSKWNGEHRPRPIRMQPSGTSSSYSKRGKYNSRENLSRDSMP